MFELSVGAPVFLGFLVLSPLVLRNQWKGRGLCFLFLNLFLYFGGTTHWHQAVVAAIWVLVPFYAVRVLRGKKTMLLLLMLLCYAYLMQYDWIFGTLHIPHAFAWKLLGLSYFLFRQIDFIMQYEYLEEEKVRITLVDYLNYLLCFYTLLAGPIQRYERFVVDFYEKKEPLTRKEIFSSLNRALNGLLKVFVVSGILMYYSQQWFGSIGTHSGFLKEAVSFFIFALLNGFYIYFNFSGYCDVVIPFAKLAGVTVPENFNRPYLSRSMVEFWNRHHITLSEWLRDYVYSPMFKGFISGPCQNYVRLGQYIALFLNFTIAGIWHGTDLNYLVYGLLQGTGIIVSMLYKEILKKRLGKQKFKAYQNNTVVKWAETAVTWTYICLTFSFVGFDVVGLVI